MPQSNRGFSKMKMNKDFDERIVPEGEYRDALNIEISSSDGSDVGSAQAVLGNVLISSGIVPKDSTCVGSIGYEKEDKIYYFVAGPQYNEGVDFYNEGCWKDYIIEYDIKTESFKYVFVDIYRVHYKVIGQDGRKLVVGNSPLALASNARREMTVNGYDFGNPAPVIVSDDQGEVTEVTGVGITSPNYFIEIYSSQTDYNVVAVGNPVIQCTANRVLNFNIGGTDEKPNLITGINIIDNMIFWTDNYSEPKKINITRSIGGTGGSTFLPGAPGDLFTGDNADFHTRLCVTPDKHNGLRVLRLRNLIEPHYSEEENVTVIRKAPKTPPRLEMSQHEDGRDGDTFSPTTGGVSGPPAADDSSFSVTGTSGNTIKNPGDVIGDIVMDNPVHWELGDMILFNQNQDVQSAEGFTDYDVRATVIGPIPLGGMPSVGPWHFLIESINREYIDEEPKSWNLRLEERKPLFEFKFVRFAYRYKYEDGEYSTFSPWSEPAFLPGEYDYLPKKGFNLGMTNRLRQLKITHYISEYSERPKDIVEIDLLYKDETSPNVYTVETIKMTDGWDLKGELLWPDEVNGPNLNVVSAGINASRGEYKVTSELIHKTVPSNQLLRPWDNIPRKALAQSISGNRLVYGNYLQNFNIVDNGTCIEKEIKPIINVSLQAFDAPLNAPDGTSNAPLNGENTLEGFASPGKTCRSLRTYQVGVVYGDEFGRETPVLAGDSGSGSLTIEKENSSTLNKLRVDIGTPSPEWAHYYKLFVKETSNEYYNMSMDRWYDAEDGNIWLSFASADRNKVDEETFIILKKKHDSHEPVIDPARYKILAIENEAPDFLKTNVKSLGIASDNSAKSKVGTSSNGFPMPENDVIWLKNDANGISDMYDSATESIAGLISRVNAGTLHIRVRTTTVKSEWYQVVSFREDGSWLKFKTDKVLGEDTAFTSDNQDYSSRISGLKIELADWKVENKKEFEGRFFVKIFKDLVLIENLLKAGTQKYKVKTANKIGYFNMPRQSYSSMTSSGSFRWWSQVGVNVKGELDASSGYWWDADPCGPSSTLGTTTWSNHHDLFFRTGRGPWVQGPANNSCLCCAQAATADWCSNSYHRFFIDSKWTRGTKAGNHDECREFADANCNDLDASCGSRGRGIHNKNDGSPNMGGLSMDIGYMFPGDFPADGGSWGGSDEADQEFIDLLKTVGTTFRWREDPDGIIYTITGSAGATSDDSRYGKHHNIDESSSYHDGNNMARWRIDFERLDQPGVGFGQGDSGYHPIGGKDTTAVAGRQELGFWGGRHNTVQWPMGTASNGRTKNLNIPTPPGYGPLKFAATGNQADINTVHTSSEFEGNDPNNSNVTVTKREQTCRYRNHAAKFHHIEIVEPIEDEDADWSSKNPAVWETEPKEDVGMDIYYEASPAIPITINYKTNEMFAPYGSKLVNLYGFNTPTVPEDTYIMSWSGNQISLSNNIDLGGVTGSRIGFQRPDGLVTYAITNETGIVNVLTVRPHSVCPAFENFYSDAPHNQPVDLSWYNAFAFGNGIESDRIRDDFNQSQLANGVKASSTVAEQYKEERRKTGLIHSGIYNSTSGVNNLNQFIQAEKITKDMNPEYGSIQKLHARDGNIVVMHEDKIMKVLANKNALFNADGKSNVAISDNFLGTDEPYATRYGISTNPESFATDLSGRIYFADRARSAILRLSKDGITNISDYGMKDWFNDHLNPQTYCAIGTFDAKKGLYNISIKGYVSPDISETSGIDVTTGAGLGGCVCSDGVTKDPMVGGVDYDIPFYLEPFEHTVSFSEKSKGWVSFLSFIPEAGISVNNEYYTWKNGQMYKHHANSNRNFFYGDQYFSTIDLLFNDAPETVKSFSALSYEGTQARITPHVTPAGYSDSEYYNLNAKDGWYVDNSITDLQSSGNIEFKSKEGKWFGIIRGNATTLSNLDEREFSVQGIGVLGVTDWSDTPDPAINELQCLEVLPMATCGEVYGCTDPNAVNYNPNATIDDGTCDLDLFGCTDPLAFNTTLGATVDDGSCCYVEGCTDPAANNYNPLACVDDGTCSYVCINGPVIPQNIVIFPESFLDAENGAIELQDINEAIWPGPYVISITPPDGTMIETSSGGFTSFKFSDLPPQLYQIQIEDSNGCAMAWNELEVQPGQNLLCDCLNNSAFGGPYYSIANTTTPVNWLSAYGITDAQAPAFLASDPIWGLQAVNLEASGYYVTTGTGNDTLEHFQIRVVMGSSFPIKFLTAFQALAAAQGEIFNFIDTVGSGCGVATTTLTLPFDTFVIFVNAVNSLEDSGTPILPIAYDITTTNFQELKANFGIFLHDLEDSNGLTCTTAPNPLGFKTSKCVC